MTRRLWYLALILAAVSVAIVAATTSVLLETEGATVIERTRTEWVPVERLVYVPVTVTPTPRPVRPAIVRPDAAGTGGHRDL